MLKVTRQTQTGYRTFVYEDHDTYLVGRPKYVRVAFLDELRDINKLIRDVTDLNEKCAYREVKSPLIKKKKKELKKEGLDESGKTKAKSLRHFLTKIGMSEKKVEKMSDSEVQKLASQKRKEMGKVKIEEAGKEWSQLSPEEKKKRQTGWKKDVQTVMKSSLKKKKVISDAEYMALANSFKEEDKKKIGPKFVQFLKRQDPDFPEEKFRNISGIEEQENGKEKAVKTSENEGGAKDKWTVADFEDQVEEYREKMGDKFDEAKMQGAIDKATEIAKKSTESAPGKATRAEVLGIMQRFMQEKG